MNLLHTLGWKDHHGKTDWKEIKIDIAIISVMLGGAVAASYLF